MDAGTTTVAVVPREAFGDTRRTIESVCASLTGGTRVVVVDCGAPQRVQQDLARLAREHDLLLVRSELYLSPNASRNLALRWVETEFVVFIDNDVTLRPGSLAALEQCARDTSAWIVSPLYLMGSPGEELVHHLDGDARIVVEEGRRRFRETHFSAKGLVPGEIPQAERRQIGQGEFHCMLVRHDVFDRIGPLDEGFLSIWEHCDLAMLVREAGGEIWFEPGAVATYQSPRFTPRGSRAYWVLRWCDDWNTASLARLEEKWDLDRDDPDPKRLLSFSARRRRYAYRPYTTPFNRIGRFGKPVVDLVDRVVQHRVLARYHAAVAAGGEPRVVHAASWLTAHAR